MTLLFPKFIFCLPFTFKTCLISVKEVTLNWDPTAHMAIHDRINEVIEDGQELQGSYMQIQQYMQRSHLGNIEIPRYSLCCSLSLSDMIPQSQICLPM